MRAILVLLLLVCAGAAQAQHNHTMTTDSSMGGMHMSDMAMDSASGPPMTHAFSMSLPMNRNGSGTGWLPDSTPMYGYMFHSKKWMFMAHGNIFVRYNKQDVFDGGSRDGEKADAVSWLMLMGQRRVGQRGLFHFSSMFSLDALFGANGYPLLFQTGESYKGQPLVDRQHPHDLVSELSVAYTYSVNQNVDVFVYAGYPGEPALGSVAFMHRVSSLYNPDAPISHHWNDGTHITFGVATAGIRLGRFKLDASVFTGREPNENRYDFDRPRFDSYSGRVSFNPNAYWSFQVSEGFERSPEDLHPAENVYRTTASAIYSRPLKPGNFLNATALWGLNSSHQNENAALLEAALIVKRWAAYGRYEYVQKTGEELNLGSAGFNEGFIFPVNVLTLGLSYDVLRSRALNMAIGAQGSVYGADSRLNALYGTSPASAEVYIRIYPPRMITMRKMKC